MKVILKLTYKIKKTYVKDILENIFEYLKIFHAEEEYDFYIDSSTKYSIDNVIVKNNIKKEKDDILFLLVNKDTDLSQEKNYDYLFLYDEKTKELSISFNDTKEYEKKTIEDTISILEAKLEYEDLNRKDAIEISKAITTIKNISWD